MATVFTRFEIHAITKGGTILLWEVNPLFEPASPAVFRLYQSRSGVGDWIAIGTAEDTYMFLDENQWKYGKAPRWHYKVTVEDAEGSVYESCTAQVLGNLPQRDSAILKEMIRKETLRLTGYSGTCGWVFKKRRWGTKCPECLDYDTGEIVNANCDTCLGTGWVGGYFSGVQYWFADSIPGIKRRTQTHESGQGVTGDRTWAARGLNCPWLDTGDVWINSCTDERFIVQSVQEIAYRSIPFVFDPVELRLAPATDIVYNIIRPDEEPESSSN
jgi:hypothetical protein